MPPGSQPPGGSYLEGAGGIVYSILRYYHDATTILYYTTTIQLYYYTTIRRARPDRVETAGHVAADEAEDHEEKQDAQKCLRVGAFWMERQGPALLPSCNLSPALYYSTTLLLYYYSSRLQLVGEEGGANTTSTLLLY